MTRARRLALAFGLLAVCGRIDGQTAAVSDLHTVSIHVADVETYNAAFRLLTDDFRLPLVFGKPLTPDLVNKRNYAGIWAGNVRLEICGPYPDEFKPGDRRARLHGLTFRPNGTAETSILELDRRAVRHKGIQTWGSPSKFVIFDDPALIRPHFSISIMDVGNRPGEEAEQRRLRAMNAPRVREVRIAFEDDDALDKWMRFVDLNPLPSGAAPMLRAVKGPRTGIDAVVFATPVDAKLLERARAFGISLTN